jgi:hypothetical protein
MIKTRGFARRVGKYMDPLHERFREKNYCIKSCNVLFLYTTRML